MSYKRLIKDHEVLVDRDIGEATITVTLYSRNIKSRPTIISEKEIIELAAEGGAEVLEILSGSDITNRWGEVTGRWLVKIPSIDPENSTMTVLKKRKKKAQSKQESGE